MRFQLVNLFTQSAREVEGADVWKAFEALQRERSPEFRFTLLGEDKRGLLVRRKRLADGHVFDFRLEFAAVTSAETGHRARLE